MSYKKLKEALEATEFKAVKQPSTKNFQKALKEAKESR